MAWVYPNERRLFRVCAVIAGFFWLVLIAGTFGVALFYALLGAIIALFAQSAFISHLRGTGVLVSRQQLPSLHERVLRCCRVLGIEEPPEVYVLNAHGVLNALATRFLRRHYVVLYSEVIDSLVERPAALDFYLGHELGHIARGHLFWSPLLWPARMLPLLGPAYARAGEYSCDLHGLACCEDPNEALHGLAVLAAGDQSAKQLDVAKFAGQSDWAGGFWMSFHELIASYPWLTKRARRLMTAAGMPTAPIPRRHLLAWPFAAFVPGVGGAAAGALIPVAVLGIVAAIAVPNFIKFQLKSKASQVGLVRGQLQEAATRYIEEHGELPPDLAALGLESPGPQSHVGAIEIGDGGFELVLERELAQGLLAERVALTPYVAQGKLYWNCGESIPDMFRSEVCGEPAMPPASPAAVAEAEQQPPAASRDLREPDASAPEAADAIHGRWHPLSPEASGYREIAFGAANSVIVTLSDGAKALGTYELDGRKVAIEVSAPGGPESARYEIVESGSGPLLRPLQGGSFYGRN